MYGYGGYGGYGYCCSYPATTCGNGMGRNFALIVVLFILLIIVGCSFYN